MIKINLPQELVAIHKLYAQEKVQEKAFEVLYKSKKIKGREISKKVNEFIKLYLGIKIDDANEKIESSRIIYICTTEDLIVEKDNFEKQYEKSFGTKYEDDYNDKKDRKIRKELTRDIIDVFEEIFSYNGFSKNDNRLANQSYWNRKELLNRLNINVCPYCNRNYISNYYDKKKGKSTTATLDHYYTKDKYPFLAVNIYNLIPSCPVCNSYLKGQNQKLHLQPYSDESDSLYFKIEFKTIGQLYNFNSNDIKINIEENLDKEPDIQEKASGSKDVFYLKSVYEVHRSDVFKLKNQIKEYLEFKNAKEYLEKQYGKDLAEKLNNINIEENWFQFLGVELQDMPLTKLKTDIYKQIMDSIE